MPESKQNRVYAESVSSWMRSDLLNNNFDPTFEKYKRDALKPDEQKPDDDISIDRATVGAIYQLQATPAISDDDRQGLRSNSVQYRQAANNENI